MDPNAVTNLAQLADDVSRTAQSVAKSVGETTSAFQYIVSTVGGVVGMFAHHVFLATLAVRFIVAWVVMGILWHAGWTDYHSIWDFGVGSIFLVGLGAICANVGKVAAAVPMLLPVLMLIDAGCFAFVDWFIPGMSAAKPILSPVMYSFVLLVVQVPLNYAPA